MTGTKRSPPSAPSASRSAPSTISPSSTRDPHVRARESLTTFQDDALGPVTLVAPTPKLGATPGHHTPSRAPRLSAHTDEVLRDWLALSRTRSPACAPRKRSERRVRTGRRGARPPQHMTCPPFTSSDCPVMHDARSDAKKTTAPEISWESGIRPSGICARDLGVDVVVAAPFLLRARFE